MLDMQQHPLPQDITGYQFHIIGNMTLKQFAEVGLGFFVAFLIYTTNLIGIIKWPLMGIAAAAGAAAAFVPFEERPLDHWIITFFTVMYKPTKFFWKKEVKIPEPFLYEPTDAKAASRIETEIDLTPARRSRIKEYMTSISSDDNYDSYEEYQQSRIDEVLGAFSQVQATHSDIKPNTVKPNLKVRVRELKLDTNPLNQQQISADYTEYLSSNKTVSEISQVAQNVAVPSSNQTRIEKQKQDQTEPPPETITQTNTTFVESAPQTQQVQQPTQASHFNQDLPFPALPTEPNKPVGMVIDDNNKILPNTIVEIATQTGIIARAVKTNSLGQFFITTPLKNGDYIIQAEKDGFSFPTQTLALGGKIVKPIEIRGQKA